MNNPKPPTPPRATESPGTTSRRPRPEPNETFLEPCDSRENNDAFTRLCAYVCTLIGFAAGCLAMTLFPANSPAKPVAPISHREEMISRWFEAHVRTCPECNKRPDDGGPAAICPEGLELFKRAATEFEDHET